MKEIFREFINGSSAKKLAILSDFATILGVSVATVVAGPFLSRFAGVEFNLADFVISVLFVFCCLWVAGECLYYLLVKIFDAYKESNYRAVSTNSIILMLSVWFAIVAFPFLKYHTGNIFDASYLLPARALSAISGFEYSISSPFDERVVLEGLVTLNEGAKATDYVAVFYARNKQLVYEIQEYGRTYSRDYAAPINSQGRVSMPIHRSAFGMNGAALVFYRRSDWSFFKGLGVEPGYPNLVPQLPNDEMETIGAYVVPIDITASQ
ncbi:hypothetical protein [Rheinheimera pleomorphica]|uniref:hypothetical protein n=1 Tax=Rheinheimera pleomorphica TaxID=2703963 RepID=UPI0014246568|nr:hypothetical protein [Rheinheimera pleomorphica]